MAAYFLDHPPVLSVGVSQLVLGAIKDYLKKNQAKEGFELIQQSCCA